MMPLQMPWLLGPLPLLLWLTACGTQSLGWVEQAACRPYTASAADSALVSVMPEVAAGGYCPGEDSASHAVCARALKLAAQYQNVNDLQQVCAGRWFRLHSSQTGLCLRFAWQV